MSHWCNDKANWCPIPTCSHLPIYVADKRNLMFLEVIYYLHPLNRKYFYEMCVSVHSIRQEVYSLAFQSTLLNVPCDWMVFCTVIAVSNCFNLLFIFQVTKAYNYIHKYGHKSKLMAAAVRNKQDLFSLLG